MNVLLTSGPESTTLFTITVQGSGGSPGRFVVQHRIMAPLHRLQSIHRRLLLAGDTILSVTRCPPMGDPPPRPHPDPDPPPIAPSESERRCAAESPGVTELPSSAPASPAEETARPRRVERLPTPAHQGGTTETAVGEDTMVLLLSVVGVLTLLALQAAHHLAQQRRTHAQSRQRFDPAAAGVWKRELANLRIGRLLRRARAS